MRSMKRIFGHSTTQRPQQDRAMDNNEALRAEIERLGKEIEKSMNELRQAQAQFAKELINLKTLRESDIKTFNDNFSKIVEELNSINKPEGAWPWPSFDCGWKPTGTISIKKK